MTRAKFLPISMEMLARELRPAPVLRHRPAPVLRHRPKREGGDRDTILIAGHLVAYTDFLRCDFSIEAPPLVEQLGLEVA